MRDGTIVFDGNDVTGRSAVSRSRAGMRRTFQRQQVFGRLTVEENLLCALEWRGGGGGILADLVALPPRRRIERRRSAQVGQMVELDPDQLAAIYLGQSHVETAPAPK